MKSQAQADKAGGKLPGMGLLEANAVFVGFKIYPIFL